MKKTASKEENRKQPKEIRKNIYQENPKQEKEYEKKKYRKNPEQKRTRK